MIEFLWNFIKLELFSSSWGTQIEEGGGVDVERKDSSTIVMNTVQETREKWDLTSYRGDSFRCSKRNIKHLPQNLKSLREREICQTENLVQREISHLLFF